MVSCVIFSRAGASYAALRPDPIDCTHLITDTQLSDSKTLDGDKGTQRRKVGDARDGQGHAHARATYRTKDRLLQRLVVAGPAVHREPGKACV
jgi:hypothetical protein